MQNSFQEIREDDGVLVPIEFEGLPFVPKRIFYVYDVPKGEERGNHAHYKTEQIIVCIKGQIEVKTHNGQGAFGRVLNPGDYVYIKSMIWDSQVFLTGDDVLLSICSTKYDKNDYIEDFDRYLSLVKEMTSKTEDPLIHFSV